MKTKIKKENKVIKLQNFYKGNKIAKPNTTPQIMQMFFKQYFEESGILQLDETHFSVCFEYEDIAFSLAKYREQENIFLKWVDYLHSFNFLDHIQVICFGTPIQAKDFRNKYIFDEKNLQENEKKIAKEFNYLIENCIGNKEQVLKQTRQIVISTKADSIKEAQDTFLEYQLKSEEKFKELNSKIRRVSIQNRLISIYNMFHTNLIQEEGIKDIVQYAKDNNKSIYEVLAPKEDVSLKEKNYIQIGNKKFIRVLYVSKLAKSITPRFYNKITTLENCNIVTTLNITPSNPTKTIQKIDKKISGMKTERLEKIKKASKNGYDYEAIRDEKLEDSIQDAQALREALQKKKQKLFMNNMLICIQANSLEELNKITKNIKSIANVHLITISNLDWQQLEGIQNCLNLGWNNLQIQRSLTSEGTAVNIPFHTKDLMQENAIFYGRNLISKNPVFADRKQLINGNGAVLATSGAGKSFSVKLIIEQVLLRYPLDEVVIIDPQGEYSPIIHAFDGQTLKLSTTADTYINPFDCSIQNSKEDLNNKIEFVLAFIESIVGNLTAEQKTIIDRVTKNIYEEYEIQNFDKKYKPSFMKFYEELLKQVEIEAKNLSLIIERYTKGAMNIFAKETNIKIKERFFSFDISELPNSLNTTGYLVALEHIMNRIKKNKQKGVYTWIFIDEFHILLSNEYSANYIAKIYKTGRKENAIPTVITQNITDVYRNEQGYKILSNSEFAMILKQKYLDLGAICEIFNISEEEAKYIIDSPIGQGIIINGQDKVVFRNQVPKDFILYSLNQTSNPQSGGQLCQIA